jgi:hypothetical protein
MNPDRSEARLRAVFQARLDAAPPPGDAVWARTLTAINADRPRRVPRRSPARWWNALAAPARFATAAAIVIVGGTVAFGTVKAVHDRAAAPAASPATRITLDRWVASGSHVAHAAQLELAVLDVAAAAHGVAAVARRERGAVIEQSPAPRAASLRIVVRVPAARLAQTLAALSALGTTRSHSETSLDLSARLAENARALAAAQHAWARADIARLTAERAALQTRIDEVIVAVTLRSAATAQVRADVTRDELLQARARRTDISLAWKSPFETHRSLHARRRFHLVRRAARRTAAARARANRTAT